MIVDTVVRNGIVVTPARTFPGGVAIDQGKIAAITTDAMLPEAREVIDAKGCYITPGFIDAHVHNGNEYPFGHDVRGKSFAAAQGGVTTMIGLERSTQMIWPRPQEVRTPEEVPPYAEAYVRARDEIDANSIIDMGLTLTIMTDAQVDEIERAVRDWGVTSFKFLMQWAGTADRWAARNGFPLQGYDLATMFLAFEKIGQLGRPALATVHAENRFLERAFRERVLRSGRTDLAAWADVCAPLCEIVAIREAGLIARHTKAAVYVVHLSTAEALPEIERARDEGTDYTIEVNVPWLCVTTEEDPPGVYGKFLPPLRDRDNQERLWEGLRDRTIQCMGTDDATVSRRWKETRAQLVAEADRKEGKVSAYAPVARKPGDPHTVWTVGAASSGVETYVPALMTYGVLAGRISIERLVEVACENNAKAFALYPKKGALEVGSDADLNIIDPQLRRTVTPQPLPQDPKEQLYNFLEGRELAGWPRLTMVRGTVVCREGAVVGKPGHGRLVERKGYPQPYPWWPR